VCDPAADIDRPDERFADRFAVALLMPASDVVQAFESRGLSSASLTSQQLGSLAGRYNVSLHAMAIRLEELGLVPKGTTQALIAQWEASPKFRRRPKTAPWKRRLGESYVSLACNAHVEGRISVGKLAEYLGLPIRKAMAVAQEARGQRNEGD
jgi:Zn-dependent peptidase ImmA (M78 family)